MRPAQGPVLDGRLGLSGADAAARLQRFGPNELPAPRRDGLAKRAGKQFLDPMALLLVSASAVSGLGLGKWLDAIAIGVIVVANVVIALVHEGRATGAVEALRAMETPAATVMRGETVAVVPARDLVPGDLVLLKAGDRVPADLRLIETTSAELDESILTGESLPVRKDAGAGNLEGVALADQLGMAFTGTVVVRGSARGVAVATGVQTQLGRIAERLDRRVPPTPLQRQLRSMTLSLGLVATAIAVVVFLVTLMRLGASGGGLETAFLSAAALAVAAVPEGLPTVVTVALALGVRRMATHGSIVRRLPAVETLGSTTVILTDKTGTLTENRMRVDAVLDADCMPVAASKGPIADVLALCNDATVEPPTGDPMEIALLEAVGAERVHALRQSHRRSGALPFDSERKRMLTAHAYEEQIVGLVKGAPETVLALCTRVNGARLNPAQRNAALERAETMAGAGARVLALGMRPHVDASDLDAAESDLVFVGLVALRDGVRPEAAGAVKDAKRAGIKIMMVTGDHPGTAIAVAQEVGLSSGEMALTGADLRRDGLPSDPLSIPVYARVDPDEKLALTEALQAGGHVVAVTGDGVNDAPALRRADIGVAMGRSGSDVAREASDMIVTDDNLATIVTAVREGRGIYDNVRKVVEYLVAGNLSEIMVVVSGLLFFPALGVPLLPLQLLWINLLTDGFPALALGVDPVDPGVMTLAPRRRADGLLSRALLSRLLLRASFIAGASMGSLVVARYAWNEPWSHARALMFSVLMTAHLLYAFAVRARSQQRNPWLIAAVVGGLALQVMIVLTPAFQPIFGTAALSVREWVLVVGAGCLPAVLMRAFGVAGVRTPAPA